MRPEASDSAPYFAEFVPSSWMAIPRYCTAFGVNITNGPESVMRSSWPNGFRCSCASSKRLAPDQSDDTRRSCARDRAVMRSRTCSMNSSLSSDLLAVSPDDGKDDGELVLDPVVDLPKEHADAPLAFLRRRDVSRDLGRPD